MKGVCVGRLVAVWREETRCLVHHVAMQSGITEGGADRQQEQAASVQRELRARRDVVTREAAQPEEVSERRVRAMQHLVTG